MNCRPNDLAIVIDGPAIGTLVECLEFVGDVGIVRFDDFWKLKLLSSAPAFTVCRRNGEQRLMNKFRAAPGSFALFPDRYLRPLRGELTPDQAFRNLTEQVPA